MKNLFKVTLLTMISVTALMYLVTCKNPKTQAIINPSAPLAKIDSIPFVEVDSMPVFSKGGDAELLSYITKNTVYPPDAKKHKVQGKVVVRFVVNADGKVSDATILTGVSKSLNTEALRVVNSLPKFEKPGFVKGKPVKTFYMVPITFSLK